MSLMSSFQLPSLLNLRSEQGFTLLEALVAIATGVIVTSALLTILEVSLRQQARITDRAQADQIGRTAMSNIIEELHSSCTGATPIQGPNTTPTSPLEKTNGNNLWFVSAYGNANSGEPLIEKVTEHDINWAASSKSSTGEQLGKLTDYSFTSIAGNSQEGWTFPSLTTANATSTRLLAKNVIKPSSGSIFQYYKYESNSASSTYGQLVELTSGELPLTEATAKNIAKVAINFTQAPEGEDTRIDRNVSFNDAVVLRVSPTSSGSVSPCE
jgi:type II secretory pathway component PulJ